MIDPNYGMTTVDLNNTAYRDEPFVLATDVTQVFYVKDMSTKPTRRELGKLFRQTKSRSDTLFFQGKRK